MRSSLKILNLYCFLLFGSDSITQVGTLFTKNVEYPVDKEKTENENKKNTEE